MTLSETLTDYINAAFSGLWVQTYEPDVAEASIHQLADTQGWQLKVWDCATGIHGIGGADTMSPIAPLGDILVGKNDDITLLVVLHNYHKFLSNAVVMQKLFNEVVKGKHSGTFYIVLSHQTQIPPELEKVFVVIEHALPDHAALQHIAETVDNEVKPKDGVAAFAAAGLTHYEAEGTFSLSIARHADILPETVWELKASALKKSGLLEMHRGPEKFADLGGLNSLKSFCRQAVTNNNGTRAKGVMLLGVPGTGKSHFARALGGEARRPVLLCDVGSFYGSLVGQTEERIRQALKIADAMAPCILFIDEIEKALAGAGGQGDSGVATRLFGTLLTWLSDHTSDVFVVATSNDVSKLPPEFTRAERWDAVFFLDLPTHDEQQLIWGKWMQYYQLAQGERIPDCAKNFHWTGAEIKSCCRLSRLLDISVEEAAEYIVPVYSTSRDRIQSLREWASDRCLSASTLGTYRHDPHHNAPTTRRAITRSAK